MKDKQTFIFIVVLNTCKLTFIIIYDIDILIFDWYKYLHYTLIEYFIYIIIF